jgi:hypothetical protein
MIGKLELKWEAMAEYNVEAGQGLENWYQKCI